MRYELGQEVKYNGKVWRIVGSTNAPSYALLRDVNGKGKRVAVIGDDIKRIKPIEE